MPLVQPRRRIEEQSKFENRPRIHRAYLAEDYDGIGQYVMVTMARTSTATGIKARIAAGDFGTGQVIPAGTPISVFVYHGQIEILSLGVK